MFVEKIERHAAQEDINRTRMILRGLVLGGFAFLGFILLYAAMTGVQF